MSKIIISCFAVVVFSLPLKAQTDTFSTIHFPNTYTNTITTGFYPSNFRSGFIYQTNGSMNYGLTGPKANLFRFRWLAHDNGTIGYDTDTDQIMSLDGNGNLNLKGAFTTNGNVGIGTTSPLNGTTNSGLHVSKGNHSTIMLGDPAAGYGGFIQTSDNKHRLFIGTNLYDDVINSWKTVQTGKGIAGINIIADEGTWGTVIDFVTNTADTYNKSMSILGNGNVGIGTSNPQSKLAVNGEIFAKRVKVTQTGWADFVFDEGYKLPGLSEVEGYIKTNKHLPDIPSAAEVEKEGLDVGEMNKKLLQKVEELTLYLIEQQKQIEAQNKRIRQLENKQN